MNTAQTETAPQNHDTPPEGIVLLGQLDPDSRNHIAEYRGGEDIDLSMSVKPERRLLPQVTSAAEYVDDYTRAKHKLWHPTTRQQMNGLRGAMRQLEHPLRPSRDVDLALQRTTVPPEDVQRTAGTFHQEIIPTTVYSDNPEMMTEYAVGYRETEAGKIAVALSKDALEQGYGLTTDELDDMSEEQMAEHGIELWRPPANEVIFAQFALHRAAINRTGEEQPRTFGRGVGR